MVLRVAFDGLKYEYNTNVKRFIAEIDTCASHIFFGK